MKICIFGGSFDPPHLGHQAIVVDLLTKDFDKIIIMPTGDVNYKIIKTSKKHRYEMVQQWINTFGDLRLILDDYEYNYYQSTYDTIKYLENKYPNSQISMAIGQDSYQDLPNWEGYDYLINHVDFLVYNRNNSQQYLGTNIDISSTMLRQYFNPLLVVPGILNYIVINQLYDLQPYIVKTQLVKPQIDPNIEIKKRILYIKQTLLASHKHNLVLGLSGGQDSTLCAKLASMAIKELGNNYHLYLLRLPYYQQLDEADCQAVIKWLAHPEIIYFNIGDNVDFINNMIANTNDFVKGNIKARMRMIVQYSFASKNDALVLGTDHGSENTVGFFTKYGDGASDLNPLFGLNKRQGKLLLQKLQAPANLYNKIPTADLEDNKPLLADEVALGISYDIIDDYLEGKKVNIEDKIKIEQKYVNNMHKRQFNNYGEIL